MGAKLLRYHLLGFPALINGFVGLQIPVLQLHVYPKFTKHCDVTNQSLATDEDCTCQEIVNFIGF